MQLCLWYSLPEFTSSTILGFGVLYGTKPCQTKETLRTFLASLMSKSGKMRQLVKEIKGKFVDDASTSSLVRK